MSSPTPPPPMPPPPPPGAGGPPQPPGGGSGGASDLGMDPKVAALLSYAPCCVGLIMSVVVAVVEKKNAFLRFNAFQSLLIHGVAFALSFAFTVLSTMLSAMDAGILGLLVSLVSLVVSLGLLGLMIFMMIKAYGGEELQLPYIGPMAKKWSA